MYIHMYVCMYVLQRHSPLHTETRLGDSQVSGLQWLHQADMLGLDIVGGLI